ncbi:hypothetical protein NliqN6_3673 [Naganishia liquefaciens]|uniref:Uncharacterized protein n=1 Tax=Naganishia liquefaciens TaxID=104408 RepID=A0A8H3TTK1_9TREE|nr:hypothetical protein NliqN6_3673 [Naganishia liquefaciens]
MIPRNPTTIALRAEDIQDMNDQIAERKAKASQSKDASSASAAANTTAQEGKNELTEGLMPGKGVPQTTLDARKGKSRNERLGL